MSSFKSNISANNKIRNNNNKKTSQSDFKNLDKDPRKSRKDLQKKKQDKEEALNKTVFQKTFVCSANRCIMSILKQPITNRASVKSHTTMPGLDLHVCMNCVDRHSDKKCSVVKCDRVNVFGEDAHEKLAFYTYTDNKYYCWPCLQKVYAKEDAAAAAATKATKLSIK